MAVLSSERSRAPRGSKSISQAFFEALDAIPEARRAEVAKAAQSAIRNELKSRILKVKAVRNGNANRKTAGIASKPIKASTVRSTRSAKTMATKTVAPKTVAAKTRAAKPRTTTRRSSGAGVHA